MIMMKHTKLICFLLALVMSAAVVAGCKKDEPNAPSPNAGAGRNMPSQSDSPGSDSSSDTQIESESAAESLTEKQTEASSESETETKKVTETETEASPETLDYSDLFDTSDPPAPTATGEAIAELSKKLIGSTFELGGEGPEHFDNSGFVYYCCKENGVFVPRLATGMLYAGHAVALSDLAPGDILVFSAEIGGPATFEAIYVGNYSFVACFKPERPTNIQTIDDFWSARFITARRIG